MDNHIREAKNIIKDNRYLTLATSSLDGKPWASPVFYVYDSSYNFYWTSNKDSRHSQTLKTNPHISFVIFNSQPEDGESDAIYAEAIVEELIDKERIAKAVTLLNNRSTKDKFKVKDLNQVTDSGVWRIYQATPKKFWKLTDGEYINGQYVDTRVEINLL